MSRLSQEAELVGEKLNFETAVTLETLHDETNLSTEEVDTALRELIDSHMITTTPGFKYRLARNETTRAIFGDE